MLLKVSLVVAILASIATLVISHLQVATGITSLKDTLSQTQGDLARTQEELDGAKKDARTARDEAEKTARDLDETRSNLEVATANWKQQQERADKFEADWKKASGLLNDSQRDLAAWGALAIPVEQVQNRLAELAKLRETTEALNEENKVLSSKVNELAARVAVYESDKEVVPPLPPGLRGTVVGVDPQWDFVVLDIGGDQGLVPRGEMLVNRNGKLVAKVRITTVEPQRAIANVLPEWKQADVVPGDVVMH
ncbi:MAG TPA: hypothetical protein PKM43_13225 [Verrucomicrobiota bacterium]|nr:hypothetical protein [Verrucomicrobiota bacterium]HRZ36727.1 hypothetical protein [Candidatus Paceibacterota bacterium]HRZ55050.1 hypothetical protein [Candidatus Paceibacterota bacterium]